MQTTTIQFNERNLAEIARLRAVFGASSNEAVIRKALALAALVAQEADASNSVTISGRSDRKPIRVSLAT